MAAKGTAEWKGDLPSGSGTFTAGDTISGGYTFKSRFEDGPGSNPEQLIAAAHAACFSMALSNILAQAGSPPESVQTDATVTLRFVDDAPTITKIALVTTGRVPGIDQDTFTEHALTAKAGCPVSRALAAVPEITLEATLLLSPGGRPSVPPRSSHGGPMARTAIVSGRRAAAGGAGDRSHVDDTVNRQGMVMEFAKLADGNQLPMLGLGVWQVPDGRACVDAVRTALELGYRHIDTAQAYGNEASVGKALRDSGVPRDEVFITTKFYPGHKDPVAEAEKSLRKLGVDQVDLYLVHWPQRGPVWAWPGMEQARERGLARSIGVSNFGADDIEQVIAAGSVTPAVNQINFSAVEYRRGLLDACLRRDIVLEAYSPLGTGRHLDNARVAKIAERAGRTPAQVLLRWCLQHGVPVIPKSTHRERIEENAQLFDFTLSEEDMAALDALDKTHGTDRALESTWW